MMDGHTRQHVYLRSLLEEQGRRHAAVEALKIGFGGFAYVVRVCGMSRRTIYTGIGELEAMGNEDHPPPHDSHQTTLEAVQRTHTQTGLTVTPRLLDTLYELG